ncbi:MAG: GerW family sporulation protein [Clostridiales bacterium]|jgi:uncharacterized spore protein YtfJ|nr:GerW family sporulation protein [Clostridiales bacterium]
MSNNLSSNLDVLFSKLENFVSSKTVVGEAINTDGMTIIPLMDITLGVGAGASDNNSKKENGIGGLGAKITPSSVLIIQDGIAKIINTKNQDGVTKLVDLIPNILDKLNLTKKQTT